MRNFDFQLRSTCLPLDGLPPCQLQSPLFQMLASTRSSCRFVQEKSEHFSFSCTCGLTKWCYRPGPVSTKSVTHCRATARQAQASATRGKHHPLAIHSKPLFTTPHSRSQYRRGASLRICCEDRHAGGIGLAGDRFCLHLMLSPLVLQLLQLVI